MDNQKSTKQPSVNGKTSKVTTVNKNNEVYNAVSRLITDLGYGSPSQLWQAADVMSNKNKWNGGLAGSRTIIKKDFDNLIWGLRAKSNIILTKEQIDYLYASIKVSLYDYSVIEQPIPEEYFAKKAKITKANNKQAESLESEDVTNLTDSVSPEVSLTDEKSEIEVNPSKTIQPEETNPVPVSVTTSVAITEKELAKTKPTTQSKPSSAKGGTKVAARHSASKTVLVLVASFFVIFLVIVTTAITIAITSNVPFGPAVGDLEVEDASLQLLPKLPKLQNADLQLFPNIPEVGQDISTKYTVKNVGGQPLTIDRLIVGVSYDVCDGDWTKRKDKPGYGYSAIMNVHLNPGETYTYTMTRSFPLPGVYYAEPEVEIGGHWGGIKNFIYKCFTVTDGRQEDYLWKIL